MARDISSMRSTLDFVRERGELVTIKGEVDPVYEIAGIQKSLEHGPAVLFENIKGYPGVRDAGNIFSREQRVADIFGVRSFKDIKFRFVDAIAKPLPPRVVSEAPCQEIVMQGDIDVPATLPLLLHSEVDAGRIMGASIVLYTTPDLGVSYVCFKRMHFRGKNWSSIYVLRGTHLSYVTHRRGRSGPVPVTINIGAPPAVTMVAGTATVHSIMPEKVDELGIAGALQGFPVDICKAKTVDAYAIANCEWVIEGLVTTDQVWETEEAERAQARRQAPLFPEWSGHLGRASRTFKFQATAITRRKDSPIFYSPLANSYEDENMGAPLREACLWELAERIAPGLVIDVNILHAFKSFLGAVFQVKKRGVSDDAWIRNIAASALSSATLRMAIFVDDDVNIYDAEDVLWAMAARANYRTGVFTGAPGSIGLIAMPAAGVLRSQESWSEGGLTIDATVPFLARDQFARTRYPVDRVDLSKWLPADVIAAVRAQQHPHAAFLSRIGG